MTLNEIRSSIATYLKRDVDDLNVNDIDLGLVAMNQVRLDAELSNDFEFTRKLLSLSVDGVTGGSLDDAVEYGVAGFEVPTFNIKTVVDVGIFDTEGNLRPAPWATVGDSLNQQRRDNPMFIPRYPTDGEVASGLFGAQRFEFVGNKVFFFPKTQNLAIALGIEAYTFTDDWDEEDLDDGNNERYDGVWNQIGSNYLIWKSLIHLNHVHKEFVFRQEGNVQPPDKMAEAALANLITWDNFKYQQFRRHPR